MDGFFEFSGKPTLSLYNPISERNEQKNAYTRRNLSIFSTFR